MAIIEVRDVRRSFRSVKKQEGLWGALKVLWNPDVQRHEALKGVSFDIEEGAFVGLIGANGAGKTTLLKILSGLIPPTSGSAKVMGYKPFDRQIDFRRKLSLVMGQKAQLWWDLPAVDAFDLLRAIYEIPQIEYRKRRDTLAELLNVTRLLNTQIRRLSLGERMKMELIGALLHWPDIVFLDEPTIGLDVVAAQGLREFLRTFNEKDKKTMILTSHNMDDIERLCERVLILQEGKMVFDGSPEKLMGTGEKRLKLRLSEAVRFENLLSWFELPRDRFCEWSDEDSDDEAAASAKAEETPNPSVPGETKDAETVLSLDKLISRICVKLLPHEIPQTLERFILKTKVIEISIEEQSLEDVIHTLFKNGAAEVA